MMMITANLKFLKYFLGTKTNPTTEQLKASLLQRRIFGLFALSLGFRGKRVGSYTADFNVHDAWVLKIFFKYFSKFISNLKRSGKIFQSQVALLLVPYNAVETRAQRS